jgi:hypothetical protein
MQCPLHWVPEPRLVLAEHLARVKRQQGLIEDRELLGEQKTLGEMLLEHRLLEAREVDPPAEAQEPVFAALCPSDKTDEDIFACRRTYFHG